MGDAPGNDLVAKIDQALADYDVSLLFLSRASMESGWVTAESSVLIYQSIEEGRPVIPVLLEPDAPIPPLLKPIARLGGDQVDALIDAIYGRGAKKPPLGAARVQARERSLRITLRRAKEGGLAVSALLDGAPVAPEQEVVLGADFAFSYRDFLDNRLAFARRDDKEGGGQEAWLRALGKLGDALGRALFPPAFAPAVQALLDEAEARNEAVAETSATARPPRSTSRRTSPSPRSSPAASPTAPTTSATFPSPTRGWGTFTETSATGRRPRSSTKRGSP